MTMTRKEIIDRLVETDGIAPTTARKAVAGVCDAIAGALCDGEDVFIRGLGTFRVGKLKARVCVDLNKGGVIEIPERRRVKFTPAKPIKESLHG